MGYACQRLACSSNKSGACGKKEVYPCDRVLPTYIFTVLEKRWERHQQVEKITGDPHQGKLW